MFLILTAFYCRLADWILAQRCELVNWIRSQLQVLSFCDPCKNVQICKNVHPKQGRSCVAYEFIIGACQPHPFCLVRDEKLHICFTWNYRVIWIYKKSEISPCQFSQIWEDNAKQSSDRNEIAQTLANMCVIVLRESFKIRKQRNWYQKGSKPKYLILVPRTAHCLGV